MLLLLLGLAAAIAAVIADGETTDAQAARIQWALSLAALTAAAYFVTAQRGAGAASQLTGLIRFTQAAGDGDFSRQLEVSGDASLAPLEDAVARMAGEFGATAAAIESAAIELNAAAAKMAETSDEAGRAIADVAQSISSISEGAARQVDLVVRTSEVVAEIEAAIRNAADTASGAREQSAHTEDLTEEGVARATEVQEAMLAVHDASVAGSETLRSLDDKSGDIDQIVRAITDIASQTNLLALNAAIEAARAGEQGRGFAVVAEEVRRLAEDAHSSANHIAELIHEIQAQTRDAVSAMDTGLERVESGFDAVNRNRQAFFEISGAVREFHQGSIEIAALAAEIAGDAAHVREQIEEVASVAQESSASTEQVSASTQQTSAASQEVTASAQQIAVTAAALTKIAARSRTNGRIA